MIKEIIETLRADISWEAKVIRLDLILPFAKWRQNRRIKHFREHGGDRS